MPDAARRTPEAEHRREATELLVAALVRGAKNVQMFSATHPSVLQDANRTLNFLVKAIGREPALTLDLKAGDVLLDGEALAPMERTKLFANALRGLGVGQVRFSDGLSAAGLIRFLGWLNARLDEKGGAQDLQRAIQAERIDGLQLTFVLSFAVPAQEQDPAGFEGLSPRELEAFLKARTLPDFAALLAAHAAKRTSPQAQRAARMLSELRRRDLTLEEFVAAFPWGVYEHRVRARFDELRAQTAYAPKARGRHPRSPGWSREAIASWAGLFDAADAKALAERRAPEPAEVLGRALDAVREILARPGDAPELRPAVGAYTRLVAELGRSGDIARLLRELDLWEALGRDPRLDGVLFATLYQRAREGAANPATAAAVVARLAGLPKELPEFQRLVDFVAFLGQGMIGPILDAVRDCPDAAVRAKACALVGQACRRVGARPLIDRLVEPDADAALGILAALEEAGDPASRPAIAGLLGHGRRAVREAAARALLRSDDRSHWDALAAYVETSGDEEEAVQTLIAISKNPHPGLDERLVLSFERARSHRVKAAVAIALGRIAESPAAVELLRRESRAAPRELLSAKNREVRQAAREALERLQREGKAS